ncbi:MAG: HlyD family efflux transporter periplasmic adaptor subunit [bacterium]
MKRWMWVVLIIAVVLGVGIYFLRKIPKPIFVTFTDTTSGNFIREVSGTGNIDAKTYSLTFTRTGRVAVINVDEGEDVKVGQVLAELDVTRELRDISAANDKLTALNASISARKDEEDAARNKVNLQVQQAKRDLKLAKSLLSAGGSSKNDIRELEDKIDTLNNDLSAQIAGYQSQRRDLQSQLISTNAEILGLQRTIKEAKLISPVNGTVSTNDLRIGETATGSIKVVNKETIKVKARLAEADTIDVKVGQKAKIELDADPDHPIPAVVTKIGVSAEVQGTGSSSLLPITLEITDRKALNRTTPGFTVTVKITTLTLPATAQVPLEALVEERKGENKSYFVWIYDAKTKKIKKKQIYVQAKNLINAAVTGINSGVKLISLPSDTLKDGDIVMELPTGMKK